MDDRILQSATTQFKRLLRNYSDAKATCNHEILLDLSHNLRIWADLKPQLQTLKNNQINKTLFKTMLPNRKIIKEYSDYKYILAFMPDAVKTSAAGAGEISLSATGEACKLGLNVKVDKSDGGLHIKHIYLVFSKSEVTNIASSPIVSKKNYHQWMAAEIVRINFEDSYGDIKEFKVPREIFIRIVANKLEASHPIDPTENEYESIYDKPIFSLMDITVSGLPLHYLILLKIAQDIIEFMPRALIAK